MKNIEKIILDTKYGKYSTIDVDIELSTKEEEKKKKSFVKSSNLIQIES